MPQSVKEAREGDTDPVSGLFLAAESAARRAVAPTGSHTLTSYTREAQDVSDV